MATIQERGLCALKVDENVGRFHVESRLRSGDLKVSGPTGEIVFEGYKDLEKFGRLIGRIMAKVENPDFI